MWVFRPSAHLHCKDNANKAHIKTNNALFGKKGKKTIACYALVASRRLCHLFRQDALKVLKRETEVECTVDGNTHTAGLLRHYDGYGIALLRNTHAGTVAQSQFLWYVAAV